MALDSNTGSHPRKAALSLAALLFMAPLAAQDRAGSNVRLDLDFEAARTITQLFEVGSATDAELDRAFRLPGVQALYEQARRFDTNATEAAFKSTLRAAVNGEDVSPDPFNFRGVRDRLDEIGPMIEWIGANHEELASDLGRRIAEYSPSTGPLVVPVYMVLGGTSDGWAREGVFHVALHYFRGDVEGLRLLMAHELFHVAQSSFAADLMAPSDRPELAAAEQLLAITLSEGSASLLWWPEDGPDGGVYTQGVLQAKLVRNQRRAQSIFSLFDSLLWRAYTEPDFQIDSVYGIGFSGAWDSPMYYLGYHVARAIEAHRGRAVLRELLAQPAVVFFRAYAELYDDRPDDPALLPFSRATEEILQVLASVTQPGASR